MFTKRSRQHRGRYRRSALVAGIGAMLILGMAGTGIFLLVRWRVNIGKDRSQLEQFWNEGEYKQLYDMSGELLTKKPLDEFLLSLHGFAAYQMAIAQINASSTIDYVDEAIWALRKAMLLNSKTRDPRIWYVLGKAYYYKGPSYADLAIQYLQKARRENFSAADIPEYLGLCYASIHDYRSSVEALTQTLDPEYAAFSDLMLLAIAQSYIGLGETGSAKAYLFRCIESSKDASVVLNARLNLGSLYEKEGDEKGALEQYNLILEENGENAEAYFRIGEIYASQGDSWGARAEWRQAIRADPAHAQARARLRL